jgi:hypothetical protein
MAYDFSSDHNTIFDAVAQELAADLGPNALICDRCDAAMNAEAFEIDEEGAARCVCGGFAAEMTERDMLRKVNERYFDVVEPARYAFEDSL